MKIPTAGKAGVKADLVTGAAGASSSVKLRWLRIFLGLFGATWAAAFVGTFVS